MDLIDKRDSVNLRLGPSRVLQEGSGYSSAEDYLSTLERPRPIAALLYANSCSPEEERFTRLAAVRIFICLAPWP